MPQDQTTQLERWIALCRAGKADAREKLLTTACRRLERLTRKMLRSFPRLRAMEETDDVFQNAAIRLHKTLETYTPRSARHFLNLAALHIRRELVDLSRHYFKHQGRRREKLLDTDGNVDPEASTHRPASLARWTNFHEAVDQLPAEEKELFNVLWYQQVPQAEAATLLGISERTLQRRWQSARLHLVNALKGELPT